MFILDTSTSIRINLFNMIGGRMVGIGNMGASFLCLIIEFFIYAGIIYLFRMVPVVKKYL